MVHLVQMEPRGHCYQARLRSLHSRSISGGTFLSAETIDPGHDIIVRKQPSPVIVIAIGRLPQNTRTTFLSELGLLWLQEVAPLDWPGSRNQRSTSGTTVWHGNVQTWRGVAYSAQLRLSENVRPTVHDRLRRPTDRIGLRSLRCCSVHELPPHCGAVRRRV